MSFSFKLFSELYLCTIFTPNDPLFFLAELLIKQFEKLSNEVCSLNWILNIEIPIRDQFSVRTDLVAGASKVAALTTYAYRKTI